MILKISGATLAAALLMTAPAFAQDTAAPAAPVTEAAPAAEPVPAAPAVAPAADPAATETVAPTFSADGKISAPPAGKGQIVFFRASKFAGAAVSFKVRENGVERGTLSSGRYFVQVIEPGQHTYTAKTEATDTLPLEIEAGETYYVEGSISMGFMAGRSNLSPSNAQVFEAQFKKLKPAS